YSGHHIWPGDTATALSRHHHVYHTTRAAEYLLRAATAQASATARHHPHRRPRQPDRTGVPPSAKHTGADACPHPGAASAVTRPAATHPPVHPCPRYRHPPPGRRPDPPHRGGSFPSRDSKDTP